MDILFLKEGKYRDNDLIIVTPDCVESEKVFKVTESFGDAMIEAERAKRFEKSKEKVITLSDVKKMSVPELKTYAEKKELDLEGKTKKDEILEEIEKTFKEK